jgi:glycosyltransferase involved in cell wall biosynthesis
MTNIHFVYAVPDSPYFLRDGRLHDAEVTLRRLWPGLIPPKYRYGRGISRMAPLRAPYSITEQLLRYLKRRCPTKLYEIRERGELVMQKDDILLGHPWPDPGTVVQETLRTERRGRCRAMILPLHHAMESSNSYVTPLIERADIIFGIMGPYWYDTLEQSFLAPAKGKLVRVDMAIDVNEYPWLRQGFNPPGRRGYLYIGSGRPEKGLKILNETMGRLSEFPSGYVGGGPELTHMRCIAPTFVDLTPEFMGALARSYDFFVNTSVSDANPTTILEAMAWGFPVACTPQSGYYRMPSIVTLSCSDIEGNVRKLRELQYAPEDNLMQLARTNRQLVEKQYTWERFGGTVWGALRRFVD